METINDYDQKITIKTEFSTTTFYAVDEKVFRRFKKLFGSALQEVFQQVKDIPLNDKLSPNDIERLNLILKFEGKHYVMVSPSEYLTFLKID